MCGTFTMLTFHRWAPPTSIVSRIDSHVNNNSVRNVLNRRFRISYYTYLVFNFAQSQVANPEVIRKVWFRHVFGPINYASRLIILEMLLCSLGLVTNREPFLYKTIRSMGNSCFSKSIDVDPASAVSLVLADAVKLPDTIG